MISIKPDPELARDRRAIGSYEYGPLKQAIQPYSSPALDAHGGAEIPPYDAGFGSVSGGGGI